jgi:hypothetical protein
MPETRRDLCSEIGIMRVTSIAAFLLTLTAACASKPVSKSQERKTEASYRIPQGNPNGTAVVRLWGVEKYQADPSQEKARSVHLEIVLANKNGPDPWDVDAKDFYLSFSDGSRSSPSSANPKILHIEPQARFGMDLYFPIPKELASPDQLLTFDFHWQVETAGQTYANATPFNYSKSYGNLGPDVGLPYDVLGDAVFGSTYGWFD